MNYRAFIREARLIDDIESNTTTGDVDYNGTALEVYDKNGEELFHIVIDEQGEPQILFFASPKDYRMPIDLLERIIKKFLHRKAYDDADHGFIEEKKSPRAKWVKKPLSPLYDTFKASGKTITLPYCQHSSVVELMSQILCMADTYDLSDDRVRFISRAINRPDLYAVVKALEHAQNGEAAAVRAYAVSNRVASVILHSTPPHIHSERTTVTHLGPGREIIRLEGGLEVRAFELQKINGSWKIRNFRLE